MGSCCSFYFCNIIFSTLQIHHWVSLFFVDENILRWLQSNHVKQLDKQVWWTESSVILVIIQYLFVSLLSGGFFLLLSSALFLHFLVWLENSSCKERYIGISGRFTPCLRPLSNLAFQKAWEFKKIWWDDPLDLETFISIHMNASYSLFAQSFPRKWQNGF